MSALFPTYARYPYTFVKGEGSTLWDEQGHAYLDFISGIAVTNLGHVHPHVKQKLNEQLDSLWHVSNLFAIPQQEELAQVLTANSCADVAFFCNSGAEANEAAIKLARRYHQLVLGNGKYEIITFTGSFHGRTLATLTATGQDKVKEGFAPLPDGFVHAPYNDAAALASYVTEKTAAIMLEVVQGEGGVHPASAEFIAEIKRLCEAHGLLLIVDEIQTGIGRTGKLFAYQHYDIEPDIITLAKGLGNGFPLGAMLGKEHLRDAFTAGSHGTTFGGTPIACSAALATMEVMLQERLAERAAQLGDLALELLAEALADHPRVKGIRGKGLLIGIQCHEPVADLIAEAQRQKLLILPAGPNVIRLLPNLLITEEELRRGIALLSAIIKQEVTT